MDLTVPVGTKVTWKFEDSAAHTVKANDGSFTSPAMKSGQTFSFTFTKAGSYPYICSIHQYMTGTITVH
ncbi:MAG: plastocyanin [Frankiales bacterium]|nr:plastocyanin [Frankiales bacterium]